MTIRVVKGQAARKRPGRATRGASHNPRLRSRSRPQSPAGSSRRTSGGRSDDDRRSDGGGRRQQKKAADSGAKLKIIIGVVIGMVILILIIAASSGSNSSGYGRSGGRYARQTYRQNQPPPIRRDQSFRDYMIEHGAAEELKKRKARIEAYRRGQRYRDR